MRFERLLLLLLFVALRVSAQTPMDIASEPHHHLLFENSEVRVFAVSLRPSERAYVRRQHNFLVVTLQDCEMVMWAEGQSDILNFRFNQGDVRFLFGGPARGVRNDHNSEYRNITVEFLNPKVTTYGYQPNIGGWQYGGSVLAQPVDPRAKFVDILRLGEATAKDVQLLAGDALPAPDKDVSELIIPVTDVDLNSESGRMRKSQGEVAWIAGRQRDLVNRDALPARFIVVELKHAPGS
jgi:hypothetical protein